MDIIAANTTDSTVVSEGLFVSRDVWVASLLTGVLTLMPMPLALAFELNSLWLRADQRGQKLLEEGQAVEAAQVFKDPQWRGLSHYRAGNYEDALEAFAAADSDSALYNQGTTAARAGQYPVALEKLEQLVERNADYPDAAHNLEIVRKLIDDQQSQQQPQSSDQSSDNEGDQQQSESGQPSPDNSGDNSQDSNSDSSGNSDNDNSDRGGELAATPPSPQDGQPPGSQPDESQSNDSESEASAQDQQSDSDSEQQQDTESKPSQGQPETESADGSVAALAGDEVSEDDQAAEQWLRRIPDDPSQLLRNKIRLNHMIQHAEVQDMPEPW